MVKETLLTNVLLIIKKLQQFWSYFQHYNQFSTHIGVSPMPLYLAFNNKYSVKRIITRNKLYCKNIFLAKKVAQNVCVWCLLARKLLEFLSRELGRKCVFVSQIHYINTFCNRLHYTWWLNCQKLHLGTYNTHSKCIVMETC